MCSVDCFMWVYVEILIFLLIYNFWCWVFLYLFFYDVVINYELNFMGFGDIRFVVINILNLYIKCLYYYICELIFIICNYICVKWKI